MRMKKHALAFAAIALLSTAGLAQAEKTPFQVNPNVINDLGKPRIPPGALKPQPFRGDAGISYFTVSPDKCSCANELRRIQVDAIAVSGTVEVVAILQTGDRNARPVRAEVSISYYDVLARNRRTVRKQVTLRPNQNATVSFPAPRLISYRQGIEARVRVLDRKFTDTNPGNNRNRQTGNSYCKVQLL